MDLTPDNLNHHQFLYTLQVIQLVRYLLCLSGTCYVNHLFCQWIQSWRQIRRREIIGNKCYTNRIEVPSAWSLIFANGILTNGYCCAEITDFVVYYCHDIKPARVLGIGRVCFLNTKPSPLYSHTKLVCLSNLCVIFMFYSVAAKSRLCSRNAIMNDEELDCAYGVAEDYCGNTVCAKVCTKEVNYLLFLYILRVGSMRYKNIST